jgi:hypothetical protein
MKKIKLDKEEKVLSDSFNKGEWKTVENIKQERAFAKRIAKNTLQKDASILHKYTAGHPVK